MKRMWMLVIAAMVAGVAFGESAPFNPSVSSTAKSPFSASTPNPCDAAARPGLNPDSRPRPQFGGTSPLQTVSQPSTHGSNVPVF